MPMYSKRLRPQTLSNKLLMLMSSLSPLAWIALILSKFSWNVIFLKSIEQDKKLMADVLFTKMAQRSE